MYRGILVAVDNSPFSEACSTAAVSLAQAFVGQVVGSHVYAARMHERRFRQMAATLPEEYRVDKELERQRAIHDSLISLGLQLISDCYLDSLERRCQEAEVPFVRKTFDEKNWERLVEDINGSEYDLIVLGARGHGTTRPDTIGSVCLRVLRRTRTDALVIKEPEPFRDGAGRSILVALDGSQEAFGALQAAPWPWGRPTTVPWRPLPPMTPTSTTPSSTAWWKCSQRKRPASSDSRSRNASMRRSSTRG